MSTDQPTLEDYLVDQHAENTAEPDAESTEVMEGARYGRQRDRSETREPADAGTCLNCGRDLRADPDISADVLRVVADNHDRTPVCDRMQCREDYFGTVKCNDSESPLSRAVQRARSEVHLQP